MTQFCCSTCRLRFTRSAPVPMQCPQCEGPLEPVHPEQALGLQLFVERTGSSAALDAAIAAARASLTPPRV